MSDMAEAAPELAQKFQTDTENKDGNAMVDDKVQMKNEENSGQVPNKFTDADAQILGAQVGDVGKGKVSRSEEKSFTDAFGADTLFRGSTSAAHTMTSFEDKVGGMMQQIVSPVTDGVGAMDKFVHGDVSGGFRELKQAALGVAEDASMVVAPEAAPEVMAGGIAARGAVAGAEQVGRNGVQDIFGNGNNQNTNA